MVSKLSPESFFYLLDIFFLYTNSMQKHIHIIGIGGIGVSALARYYHHLGYRITGTDASDSKLIHTLTEE